MSAGGYHQQAQAWMAPERICCSRDEHHSDIPKAQEQLNGRVRVLQCQGVEPLLLEAVLPNMTQSMFTGELAIIMQGGSDLVSTMIRDWSDHSSAKIGSGHYTICPCYSEAVF
jgi:hypothetical protein